MVIVLSVYPMAITDNPSGAFISRYSYPWVSLSATDKKSIVEKLREIEG